MHQTGARLSYRAAHRVESATEPGHQPSLPDYRYAQNQGPGKGKPMKSETLDVLRPCTYPARPINGGPLELALPKPGHWYYEPKYNGWRALVHAPTGTMFNRRGQPLNIAALFGSALKHLRTVRLLIDGGPVEWFDCEALCRRHRLGRATAFVLD